MVVVVVVVGHPEGCTWAWRRMARRRVTLGRTLRDVSGAPVTGSVLRARRGAARRGGAAHRSAPIPPPAVDGNGGWPGEGGPGEWTVGRGLGNGVRQAEGEDGDLERSRRAGSRKKREKK